MYYTTPVSAGQTVYTVRYLRGVYSVFGPTVVVRINIEHTVDKGLQVTYHCDNDQIIIERINDNGYIHGDLLSARAEASRRNHAR